MKVLMLSDPTKEQLEEVNGLRSNLLDVMTGWLNLRRKENRSTTLLLVAVSLTCEAMLQAIEKAVENKQAETKDMN